MAVTDTIEINGEEREIADAYAREQCAANAQKLTEHDSKIYSYKVFTKNGMSYDAESDEIVSSSMYTDEVDIAQRVNWHDDALGGVSDTMKAVKKKTDTDIAGLNNNLVEQKMLGWTVPSECPIQNEVNGNQFIQKVSRIDLSTLSFSELGSFGYYVEIPTSKAPINNSTVANIYLEGFKTVKRIDLDSSPNSIAMTGNKEFCINNGKIAIPSGYLYYELETPITMTIDGNEVTERINDSLKPQKNLFNGNWNSGYWDSTDGQLKSNSQWSATDKYPCLGNGGVKINVGASTSIGLIFFDKNGGVVSSLSSDNVSEYGAKIPSNATMYAFNVNLTSISSATIMGDTFVTEVASEVASLKSDLSTHTHNYAGSSSAGGSANSAVKLDSSAGSATQPVYFSSGKPVACTYTLGKSVPSDAVFTDTNTVTTATTTGSGNAVTAITASNGALTVTKGSTFLTAHQDISGKMDKANPTGTGSFSLNRMANTTVGDYSFAEGYGITASGNQSHAEGCFTTVTGESSHVEGYFTTASGKYQHVQGKFNVADTTSAFIIGNGTNGKEKSNAMTVDWNGNLQTAGDITNGSGVSLNSLNSNTFKGKYDVIADCANHSWITYTVTNLSKYKMIQVLLRDSNLSEKASNITSYSMFKDCSSSTRTFGAYCGTGDANCALAFYTNDTSISLYVGSNFKQVVLVGWY